jgi:hypothetical protein
MAYVFITSLAASLLLRFLRSGLDRVPVGTTSG